MPKRDPRPRSGRRDLRWRTWAARLDRRCRTRPPSWSPRPARAAGVTQWSAWLLADHLRISFATVAWIWRKWKPQPWRVETFKFSTDPVGSASDCSKRIERELAILIADYSATREDQRQAYARQAAVLSAGIAVFAAFYYLTAENRPYLEARPLLALALPLAPYLIAQTYIWYEIDTVLRGYYVRALERAIQERVAVPSVLGHSIKLPALGYLSYIVAAPRQTSMTVRVINLFGWVAVAALFGGSAVLAISALPTAVDVAYGIIIYFTLACFLVSVAREMLFQGARKSFEQLFCRYPEVFAEPLDRLIDRRPNREARGKLTYLLLPRVAELIKWSTFLAAWAIALILTVIADPTSASLIGPSAGMALLYLVVFEYLAYQARYQWNDLRGAERERESSPRSRARPGDDYPTTARGFHSL